MKKLLKYGVASLSLATLGVVTTATDVPFIGATIVNADEANTSIISVSYFGRDPQDDNFFAELGVRVILMFLTVNHTEWSFLTFRVTLLIVGFQQVS